MTINESVKTEFKNLVTQAKNKSAIMDIIVEESNNGVARNDMKMQQCFRDAIEAKNDLGYLFGEAVDILLSAIVGTGIGFASLQIILHGASYLSGTNIKGLLTINNDGFYLHGDDVNLVTTILGATPIAYAVHQSIVHKIQEHGLAVLKQDILGCIDPIQDLS